jgi:uncharacterized protein involved in tolerance to divalent cations
MMTSSGLMPWRSSSSARSFARLERLQKGRGEVRSYETPEIVALEIVARSESYLAWMDAEVNLR